jgi:hypothetical protein
MCTAPHQQLFAHEEVRVESVATSLLTSDGEPNDAYSRNLSYHALTGKPLLEILIG